MLRTSYSLIIGVTQSRTQLRFVSWSPCRRVALNGRLRHDFPFSIFSGKSALPDH